MRIVSACIFFTALCAVKAEEAEIAIRTDLIGQTVAAIKASFEHSATQCNEKCRTERASSATSIEDSEENQELSTEAQQIVKNLKSKADVDWKIVNEWIMKAGRIQRTYFESILRYRPRLAELPKDALFFLDIGEVYNATSELLINMKTLNQIVADLSTVYGLVQKNRNNLTFKLISEFLDLTPYHETFGCAHKCSRDKCVSGKHDDTNCANVMRKTFTQSFRSLQETLNRFFIVEASALEIPEESE